MDRDTPVLLRDAPKLFFPHGGMTLSGLRTEARKGRLCVERIAGKDFVTLEAIEKMRKKCRNVARVPDCISETSRDTDISTSSSTVQNNSAVIQDWRCGIMPNHITNELIFRDLSWNRQDEILAKLCNEKREIDFEILVPAPLNMWWGNVGTRHDAFKQNHMDWAIQNWGTKWNAYKHRPINRDASLVLCFDTAWSPPRPWLAAVLNYFKIDFEHNWLDEGSDWSVHCNYGYDGESKMETFKWEEVRASDEIQKRLHVLKWGVESFPEEETESA